MAILAVDQGTTGTTVAVFDAISGQLLARATREFAQYFPAPGLVEHEPEEIWSSVQRTTADALQAAGLTGSRIQAIGITNQRETTLLWDRETSVPVHRALVWQDRRTADLCRDLKAQGKESHVHDVTGLVLDPYFSATKLAWLLANVPGVRLRADEGRLAFGTVDSYLLWRMSGGSIHATDVTNASRTMLMDVRTCTWSEPMLAMFSVPRSLLPSIVPSAGRIAVTRGFVPVPDGTAICGIAGDQQAALFGQGCLEPGSAKCTYGTGAFVLVNTGSSPVFGTSGALTTVAWQIGGRTTYALEGACFVAGAAVQWLRDGLGILDTSADVEALALSVPSAEGVVFVPALTGLGAPHWDPEARGAITGITRGTTRAHLAYATLEGIAFSVGDLVRAMAGDLQQSIPHLRVDGGAAANNLLLQIQSDVTDVTLERPVELESTARGAAMLAGVGSGLLKTLHEATAFCRVERTFSPSLAVQDRAERWKNWSQAVARTRKFS